MTLSFCLECIQLARGFLCSAMDGDEESTSLRGLRRKWQKLSHGVSIDVESHVEHVDGDSHAMSHDCPDASSSVFLPDGDKQLDADLALRGSPDLDVWRQTQFDAESLQYEPSLAHTADETADVGGNSSFVDDNAAVSDLFIRGARHAGITMPWETPLMRGIFGELGPSVSLNMPLDWGTSELPLSDLGASNVTEPLIPSQCRWSCAQYVLHKSDETYLQQKDRTMKGALAKWKFLVLTDCRFSEVGRQLIDADDEQVALVLTSVMGVKSPNTVLKRAGAMLMYFRWHAVHGTGNWLPFDENTVWRYIMHQSATCGAASRSQSFVQALRFGHYVMGFDNALMCANSRRIVGQAQLQLSTKAPTRQARPLTVMEVKALHAIADGVSHSLVDRCMASNLLLAMYGRCRVSDLNFVHEILHDVSGSSGFLEVTTRYHKSARSAQQKALLLPIVMASGGVTDVPWLHAWIANRKACGLATSGLMQGALMPAPCLGDTVSWMKRPLTPGEVSNILKGFLACDDPALSSHSLKATTLSWASKAEVPREQRRILGRHSSAVQCADSYYSRDMSIGPVNSLLKVINMVRDGTFQPDASRANYFPAGATMSASTPAHVVMQPFTPAFLEKGQPSTPLVPARVAGAGRGTPVGPVPTSPVDTADVKSESSWSCLGAGRELGVIELSSDSETESSESNSVVDSSDEDDAIDLDSDPEGEEHCEVVGKADYGIATRNLKTKVVHECRDKSPVVFGNQDDFLAAMEGELTKCGRMVTKQFALVTGNFDWTAKCRVCFKGRRDPNNLG